LRLSRDFLKRDLNSERIQIIIEAGQELAFDACAPVSARVRNRETPVRREPSHVGLNARSYSSTPGEYAAGGAAVPAIGWDYGATDGFGDIQKYALAQALPANQFVSLTLAWDREVLFEIDDGDPGVFDVGDELLDDSMPIDLNLYLMPAGETDLELAAAKSIASDTSVEHIFQQVPAGMYEIWVEQASGSEFVQQNYALAWMTATPPDLTFGDYSGGAVGPEDYTIWKSNFGSTTQIAADGNGNGAVDAADYTMWRDNFTGAGSAASIPEPGTASLVIVAAIAIGRIRRPRR
jgi:hypothetical protein